MDGAVSDVIVVYYAVGTAARSSIEVNGNELRIAIGIRDCDARSERHENVALPRHDDAVARGAENVSETEGDVERLVFFTNPLAGDTAAIETAVAGIDHDGRCGGRADGAGKKSRAGNNCNSQSVHAQWRREFN